MDGLRPFLLLSLDQKWMNMQNKNLKEKYESYTGCQSVILLCNQMIKSVTFIAKVKNMNI